MKLKFVKLHEDAVAPFRKRETDAGWDLSYYTCDKALKHNGKEKLTLYTGESAKVHTGIAVKIPEGHVGLIFDRSGLGMNGVNRLAGVIDENYTGELIVGLNKCQSTNFHENESFQMYFNFESYGNACKEDSIVINEGDRIAQLVILPIPRLELEEVDSLEETDRGDKGFGSSGK